MAIATVTNGGSIAGLIDAAGASFSLTGGTVPATAGAASGLACSASTAERQRRTDTTGPTNPLDEGTINGSAILTRLDLLPDWRYLDGPGSTVIPPRRRLYFRASDKQLAAGTY